MVLNNLPHKQIQDLFLCVQLKQLYIVSGSKYCDCAQEQKVDEKTGGGSRPCTRKQHTLLMEWAYSAMYHTQNVLSVLKFLSILPCLPLGDIFI